MVPRSCVSASFILLALHLSPLLCFAQEQIIFPRKTEPICTTFDGSKGRCTQLFTCSIFLEQLGSISGLKCTTSEGQEGICCPLKTVTSVDPSLGVSASPQNEIHLPQVDQASVNDALEQGFAFAKGKEELELKLLEKNIILFPDDAAFWHKKLFTTTDEFLQTDKDGDILLGATSFLKDKFSLSAEEVDQGLQGINAEASLGVGQHIKCPKEPSCPSDFEYSYRTMDGTCNNLKCRNCGRAGRTFQRMMPALYSDGTNELRQAVSQRPLPSPRVISTNLSPSRPASYKHLNNLIWQWGQFLDHDITLTALSSNRDKTAIACCNRGNFLQAIDTNPECRPIEIPQNDPFFKQFGQRCMEFVRSAKSPNPKCSFGSRQQFNQITSYLDGSQVYGSSESGSNKLRTFSGGQLAATRDGHGRQLLPGSAGGGCNMAFANGNQCFAAGDIRANEQVNLAVIHTVWMRQHNRLASELAQLNPSWSDEILFQEARRIVGAQLQHITYNEYLPIVLGREFVERYDMVPQTEGYFRGYDVEVDPTIVNAFATAAYRFGHSFITGTLQHWDKTNQISGEDKLSETAFNPFGLYLRETFDDMIRGFVNQKSMKWDRFFSDDVTNKLFAQTRPFGMDLVSLNIQRGRDHGLPPYTHWQEICGLDPINSWDDLIGRMDLEAIASLRRVYDNVHDIDLFIAGVSEIEVPGSLLGPTFLCIVGQQFIRLKIGDRFYYENGQSGRNVIFFDGDAGEPVTTLTEDQLHEIRKTTLARILCDNGDNIEHMQQLAFGIAKFANAPASCTDITHIPKMSLIPWKNTRIFLKQK